MPLMYYLLSNNNFLTKNTRCEQVIWPIKYEFPQIGTQWFTVFFSAQSYFFINNFVLCIFEINELFFFCTLFLVQLVLFFS